MECIKRFDPTKDIVKTMIGKEIIVTFILNTKNDQKQGITFKNKTKQKKSHKLDFLPSYKQ